MLGDGTLFEGRAFGAEDAREPTPFGVGEVVFNTGMTGYQEVLTDPSYAGQIVMFTYPLIGNYGINDDDWESDRIQPTAIVVREACKVPSNWRSARSLHNLLADRGVPGIEGLDTRAITQRIREGGVTMAAVGDEPEILRTRLETSAEYGETDFVAGVSTREPYAWGPSGREAWDASEPVFRPRMAVLDCGLKTNILRRFWGAGVRPVVFPSSASAEEILAVDPAGIVLSPGPGDPRRLGGVIGTVRGLLGKRPVFGICLGNQLLCHAVGGETYKLKFGHRGSNHSVRDLTSGKVTITSQNHGYAVRGDSLGGTPAEVTQVNVNDGTVEGIGVPGADAWSVQYHPEAAPGPWDSRSYFGDFARKIGVA